MRENVTRNPCARRWKFSKTPVRGTVPLPVVAKMEPNNHLSARSIRTGPAGGTSSAGLDVITVLSSVTLPPPGPRTTLVNAGETTGGRAGCGYRRDRRN